MKFLKSNKAGAICSYIMIALNTISSIVLVPFYLKFLGIEGYGLYQMIYSVANYILILDFGIGTTMVRFITEYRTKNDKKGEENFAAHCLLIVGLISTLILVVGIILANNIGRIYPTLTLDKIYLSKRMIYVMIGVIIMTVMEHYFEGIAIAYKSFTTTKIIGIVKLCIKFILVIILLYGGKGVISLVVTDAVAEILALILYVIYDFIIVKFKIKLYEFRTSTIWVTITFMLAFMIQSIVAYINNTVDKTLLGIMLGETASGVYGLSMTFITMFNMIPTTILTIFLPQATKMVVSGEPMESHTRLAIKLGRYQMVTCGGILSAFFIVGRDFIQLWAGTNVTDVWLIALIIMIPNAIPLIQNYCLNVLDAMGKRMFRSIVLLGISFLNIVMTIIMIRKFGTIGAPIATAISYIIGHAIVINVYYHKVIGIDVIQMWKGILNKLLICVLVTTIVCLPLILWQNITWMSFLCKCIVWAIVYLIFLLSFGLNSEEKNILKIMCKIKK